MEEYQLKENSQRYKKKIFHRNIAKIEQDNTPFTRWELLDFEEHLVASGSPQNSKSYDNKINYR